MAALSDNRATASKDLGPVRRYKMAASTTIYAGGMVMINSSGLAVPAAAAASNQGVVGVATEKVVSAASGTYYVKVQEGTFLMAADDTIADTSVGLVVYAANDQEVDETQGTNEPRAGILVEVVSSSSCWVAMGIGLHS